VEEILNNMSFDSPLAKDMGTGLRSDYEGLSVTESARLCLKRGLTLSGEARNIRKIVSPPKGQPPFQTEPSSNASVSP
jgi:hypothetical protein